MAAIRLNKEAKWQFGIWFMLRSFFSSRYLYIVHDKYSCIEKNVMILHKTFLTLEIPGTSKSQYEKVGQLSHRAKHSMNYEPNLDP